ncbi:unnamed protein product [Candidula unifasciata]|uniref:Regulator of telomere elongation helicase 1 homolog n=1 Tax=Candidula unifasciata TaxID=100452 RepID=A0A8S3ZWT5_9EUPU|nr:unnamed protein product [Candidula unifasciata]
MPLLEISGVQVNFPFTPYPCQVDYMSKVLTCLQKNQNGVLESPTGTGKTLSLLCASLAWQESRKAQVELTKQAGLAALVSSSANDAGNVNVDRLKASLQTASGASWGSDEFFVPKIIYASRTHSQLSQAVQELKRTAYNSVKSSVIGSREQLCIHQQVQKLTSNTAKVNLCRVKVAARHCHFYNNIEGFKKNGDARKIVGNVVDIEDIVKIGHKTKTCPYYMARELKTDADIVFMPYNYLLDNKSRKAHGVELQGSIIIFDEAHNLEKICEESASFDLSSLDLATAIEETTKLAERVAELSSLETEFSQVDDSAIVPEFTLEDIIRLKKTLLEMEENLDAIDIMNSAQGKTLPGGYMFEFLAKVNINWTTKSLLLDVLDKMSTFLSNDGNSALSTKGAGLSKFADCLKIVFSQEPKEYTTLTTHQKLLSEHFKVHVQKKQAESYNKKKIDSWSTSANNEGRKERILSYWCFSPGHTMKDLLAHGVKVIILTSGTLSPLDSFTMEMQIPFPVQLENPHVIEKSQVWLGTLCKGPDGTVLNSEYKNRSNETYQRSLGNTIMNFARIVPNGLLVFFPSYPVMDNCIEKWKATNQWNVITQYKPVIVEPKGKTLFDEAMDEYYTKVSDPNLNGAIFMAVCRGKVSEGLDFADTNGRAVMITGLPFPPRFDPRVQLKMDFLRENKHKFKGLNENTWYRQQATRAVNQAIGRVIRHNKDFGAIVLCDTRFSSFENRNSLPSWVREQAQVYETFGQALKDVIAFFKEAEKNFPCGMPRPVKSGQEQSVVSGASFDPSFTRRSQSRNHVAVEYERASSVACHIPGLRNSTEEEETLCKQYAKPKLIEKSKKRSLLEALESTEDLSVGAPETSTQNHQSQSQFQMPTYQPPVKKLPGKQKKIKLKENSPTEIIVSASATEMRTKIEQTKSKMAHETSLSYITEVKAVLNKELYKRFSDVLNKYLRERQIHDVVPVLADLFTHSPENHHLFKKFFRFVRQEDKQYYARTCYELTGLSCGYKPSQNDSNSLLDKNTPRVGDDVVTSITKTGHVNRWGSISR